MATQQEIIFPTPWSTWNKKRFIGAYPKIGGGMDLFYSFCFQIYVMSTQRLDLD